MKVESFLLVAKQSGGQLSQRPMGAFLVINRHPLVGNLTDLIQVFKQIRIQYLVPVGSVEPFDKSVLAWFAGLDVTKFNALVFTPLNKSCRS